MATRLASSEVYLIQLKKWVATAKASSFSMRTTNKNPHLFLSTQRRPEALIYMSWYYYYNYIVITANTMAGAENERGFCIPLN